MTTFIALIRGINVGGKNPLPMKALVPILETTGCENVKTYIQSGNVVFCGKKRDWKELISNAINANFGFKPEVLILEASSLKQIAEDAPFARSGGKTLHVFFLSSEPENPDLAGIEDTAKESEQFRLARRAFYLYAPDGIARSKLASRVERLLGVSATARNWNTVAKLLEMSG